MKLEQNTVIIEQFMVKEHTVKTKKAGGEFAQLKLRKQNFEIIAMDWNFKPENILQSGQIIEVRAEVGEYNGEPQLNLKAMTIIEDANMADFMPSTYKDLKLLKIDLRDLINRIEDRSLQTLVQTIWDRDGMLEHPAAKAVHQAYLHGLLEHSVHVTQIAYNTSLMYEDIDTDILLAGALLHDIGKMYELEVLPSCEYTDAGQLLGHIYMGAEIIRTTLERRPDLKISKTKLNLLTHIILSHHGLLEYGSPVVPKTVEAQIVHQADMMDVKVTIIQQERRAHENSTQKYTKKNYFLGTQVRLG